MTRPILFIAVVFLLATAGVRAQGKWTKLEHCHLVPNPTNDGDSFHVRGNEKEYIFRLYLVDAPEIDAANPARLIEQAKYFGVSVPQVIELGEAAKLFVQEKLAEPFTVFTRMANAMGRKYRTIECSSRLTSEQEREIVPCQVRHQHCDRKGVEIDPRYRPGDRGSNYCSPSLQKR